MAMKGKFEWKLKGMDKGDTSKSREKTPDRTWTSTEPQNTQQTKKKEQICVVYKLKTLQLGETYAEKIYFDPEDETDQDLNEESSPKSFANSFDTHQGRSFSESRSTLKSSYLLKKSDKMMTPKYTKNVEKLGQNGNVQKQKPSLDTGGIQFKRIQHENKDKKGEQNKSQEKRLGFSQGNDKNMISPLEGLYPSGNDKPSGRGYGFQRYKNSAVDEATKPTENEEETEKESPNETTNTNKNSRNMSSIIRDDWDCPEETTSSSMNDKDTDREVEKESDFLKKPTRLDELYKNLTLEQETNPNPPEQITNKNDNNDKPTTRKAKTNIVWSKKSFRQNKKSKSARRKAKHRVIDPYRTKDRNKIDRKVSRKTIRSFGFSKKTIEIQKIYKIEKVWERPDPVLDADAEAENVNNNYTDMNPELENNGNSPNPATDYNINSDGNTISQTEELQETPNNEEPEDTVTTSYLDDEWGTTHWVSHIYNNIENENENDEEKNTNSPKPSTSSQQSYFDCHDECSKLSNTSERSIEDTRGDPRIVSYGNDSMGDINADENSQGELKSDIKIDENNSISSEEMNLKIDESFDMTENTNANSGYQEEAGDVNDNNTSLVSNVNYDVNSSGESSNIYDNHYEIFGPRRDDETDSEENDNEEMLNTTNNKESVQKKRHRQKQKVQRNKGEKQKQLMGGTSSRARTYPTRNRTRQEKILSNSINYYGNSEDEGETDGTGRQHKKRKIKHKTEVERLREGLHIMFTSIRMRAKRAQKARLFKKGDGDDLNTRRKRGRKKYCILRNCQNDGRALNSEQDRGQKGPYNLRKSKSYNQNSDESSNTTGSEDDSDSDQESSQSEPESDDQNSDIELRGTHKGGYNLRKLKNDGRISYVGQIRIRKSRYNLRKSKNRTQNTNFERRNPEIESCTTAESENESRIVRRITESEAESDEQESGTNQRRAEAEPENDNHESNAGTDANTEQQGASDEREERATNVHTARLPARNDTNSGEERNLIHADYENSAIRPVVILEKLDMNTFVHDRMTSRNHVRSTRSKGRNKEARVRHNKRPSKTCSRCNVYLKRNVTKFKRMEYEMIKRKYVGKKLTEATERLPLKKVHRKRKKNDKGVKEKQVRSRVKKAPVRNNGTAMRQSIEWLKSYRLLNYSFVKSQVEYSCKLCPVTTENITAHYKLSHRGSEVMISRLNRKEASQAVADAIAKGIAGEVENNSGQVSLQPCVYTCRMCNIDRMTRFREFFVHITTHTGEYTWACLVDGCHVTAPTNELMEIHIRNEHPNHDVSISAGRVEPFTNVTECGPLYGFMCSGCNFVQVFRKNVEDHIKRQHRTSKNISIIKINLSSKETSEQTNGFEQFGCTSDERENLRERRQNEDCVIIENDVTVGYPSEPRAGDNKTSPLVPVQGNAPEVVELDFDEEPDVQSRMENDFDIKVEREIGPFTRRKWVVGFLQAQILDESGLLYDCLVKTCLFTTRVYSNFESHVRIIHSKTKWRGDCDSCDNQARADDNLTLINALEHLISHTRQRVIGSQGMINENPLPRPELGSNEQVPDEEHSKSNSDQNTQTTESNPSCLVQEGPSENQDLSDDQTSNRNNLSASETQEENVSTRTEEREKNYYLVEQSKVGDGCVFRIQQIREVNPVGVTTQEVTKRITPMLSARTSDETEETGVESTKELETNSELKLSIPTSVITSPNENSESPDSSGEFESRNENTERESPESEWGQAADDALKPLPQTQKPSLNIWNPISSTNNTMKPDNKTDNTLLLATKPRRKKKQKFRSEYGNAVCSVSGSDIFILKNHKSACFYAHKCGPILCPHCVRGFCDERCFVIRQPPHGVKQYFCNLCTFRSPVKASMNKHMNSKHKLMRVKTSPEAKALPNTDHSYSAPNSVETNQHPSLPYQPLTNTNQDRSVLQQILSNTNQDHSAFHQILPNTNQDHSVPHLILPSTTQDRFHQVLPLTNQDFPVPQQISTRIIEDFPVAHHIPPDTTQDLPVHHQILSNTSQDLPIHVQILPNPIQDRSVFHQVIPLANQDFAVPQQIPPNIVEDFPVAHPIPPNTNQDLPVYHQIIPNTNQDHSVSHLIIPSTIQDPSVLHQISFNRHQELPVHHQIPPNTIEDPSVLDQIPLSNNQDFSVPHQILPNINQECSVYHQIIPNPNQEFSVFHQIPPNTVEDFSVPHQIPLNPIEDFPVPHQIPSSTTEEFPVLHQIPNPNEEPNNFFQNPFDINQEFDGVNPNPLKDDQDPLSPDHYCHEHIQDSNTDTELESSEKGKHWSSKMNVKGKCGSMRQAPKDTAQESSTSPKVYCCPLCKTQFKAKKKVLYERHLSEEARCRQFKYRVAKPKSNDKDSTEEHSPDSDSNELRP